MKKVKIYFFILAVCIVGIIAYFDLKCEHKNCYNIKADGSKYCIEHKCNWEGCTAEKSPGNTFCYYHIEENRE